MANFRKIGIEGAGKKALAVIVENGRDYFLMSNDGTFQYAGGYPTGITMNPTEGNICSWYLGDFDGMDKAVSVFREKRVDLPDSLKEIDFSIEEICDGVWEGVWDFAELLGVPAVPAVGFAFGVGSGVVEADEIMSENYVCDDIYSGQGDYHSHHGEDLNSPVEDYDGYLVGVELEIVANGRKEQRRINKCQSNWFYQESDSSLDSYGIELVTVPLIPRDAKNPEFWRPLTDFLSPLAESWGRKCCGLHVHFSRTLFGNSGESQSETLGKLLYFYHHLVIADSAANALNAKIYGRAHTYSETLGDTETGKAVILLGKDVLKEKSIRDRVKKAMLDKTNGGGRYFDINTQNEMTIEFRKGKGSISAERIASIVAWSESMVEYCKATDWMDLSFAEFVKFVRNRKGIPEALKGWLVIDA